MHSRDLGLVRVASGRLVRQLDRGQRDLHQVVLVSKGVDDDPEALDVIVTEHRLERRPGEFEPACLEVRDGGQRLDRDGLPGRLLDGLQ